MNSKLAFFALLIQLSTAQVLLSKGIELFSLSYQEDDGLKVNVLYNPVYDEEALKKEALEIKKYEEETAINKQKIEETVHQILQIKQKEIETEQLIKKTEESIKAKKAALRKMLSKL